MSATPRRCRPCATYTAPAHEIAGQPPGAPAHDERAGDHAAAGDEIPVAAFDDDHACVPHPVARARAGVAAHDDNPAAPHPDSSRRREWSAQPFAGVARRSRPCQPFMPGGGPRPGIPRRSRACRPASSARPVCRRRLSILISPWHHASADAVEALAARPPQTGFALRRPSSDLEYARPQHQTPCASFAARCRRSQAFAQTDAADLV